MSQLSRIMICCFMLSACSFFKAEDEAGRYIEIINFEQGLMKEGENGGWYVYRSAPVMEYEINGECTVNKVRTPCMYFGYSFSYKTKREIESLDCITTFDKSLELVTPKEEVGRKSKMTWKLKLSGGHVYNIRYQSQGEDEAPEDMPLIATSVCSYNGSPVLEFVETIINEMP